MRWCDFLLRKRFGFGLPLRWHPRIAFVARTVWFACVFAGIRVLPSCFKRRPCSGRHLLFFAAAKKSRQKKAAHTAYKDFPFLASSGFIHPCIRLRCDRETIGIERRDRLHTYKRPC